MIYTICYIDYDGEENVDGITFRSEKKAQAIVNQYNETHTKSEAKLVRMRTS